MVLDKAKVDDITAKHYNTKSLNKMVDKILDKFGGLSQKDYDDFYSLADEVFVLAANDFDGTGTFEGFLKFRLNRKIQTMISERNRLKRCDIEIIKNPGGTTEKIFHQTLSLDAPCVSDSDDEDYNLYDMIPSGFQIEKEVKELKENGLKEYFERLSLTQREITNLLIVGYQPAEIREKLHISEKEYMDNLLGIKSYENISLLF